MSTRCSGSDHCGSGKEPARPPSARRRLAALLGLSAILVILSAAPGSASPPSSGVKLYDACLTSVDTSTPDCSVDGAHSLLPGGTSAHLTLTVTNDTTSNTTLGSVNLDAPAELPIDTASVSSPSPAGTLGAVTSSEIQLRDLSLAPGDSVSVSFDVTTPCVGSDLAWSIAAKQSNKFNGTGNDFAKSVFSGLVSDVAAGGCHVAFVTQPARTVVAQTITDGLYSSGGPIEVGLFDASNSLITSCPVATCTATITRSPGDGTFGGTTTRGFVYDSAAGGLVASFDDLSIGDPTSSLILPETFRLVASGLGTQATSNDFVVDRYGTRCSGQDPCVTPPVQVGSTFTQSEATGGDFVFIGIGTLGVTSCYGQSTFSSVGASPIIVTEERTSLTGELYVTYGVPKSLIQKKYGNTQGQQFIPICAGSKRIAVDPVSGGTVAVDCDAPYNGTSQAGTGWIGKALDENGFFDQTRVARAQCDPATGYFVGILGSFQDYTRSDPSLVIDPSASPTVTGWSSDNRYRYFTIRYPSSSGPAGSPFAGVPWDGWNFG